MLSTGRLFIAYLIAGTALVLGSGSGQKVPVRCYVCGTNSSVSAQCVDDYKSGEKSHDLTNCMGSETEYGCVKLKFVDVDGTQIVTRGCAPEKGMNHEDNDCKTTEVAGRKVFFCHCSEDYCNTSNIRSSPNLILLFISIASLIFVWLT